MNKIKTPYGDFDKEIVSKVIDQELKKEFGEKISSKDTFEQKIKEVFQGIEKMNKSLEFFQKLEIPTDNFSKIDTVVLMDILSNEDKLNKIVSLLKNKAFW